MSTTKPVKDGDWSTGLLDVLDDPATCIIGYCLPCVLHGQTAQKAHGGDFVMHCLKFYLYSCICACGLVSGPTRMALRHKYKLPADPQFLASQGANADCLTNTIPCLNCVALCQTARELNMRNPSEPIAPQTFDWVPAANPPQEEMVMTRATA